MNKPILTISCPEKILPEHLQLLQQGFEVVKLGRTASETELIEGLFGASVYVIGGDETVTARVIERSKTAKLHIFLGNQWETAYTSEARHLLANSNDIIVASTGGGETAVAKMTADLITNPLTLRSLDARSVGLGVGRGYQVDLEKIARGLKILVVGGGKIGTLVTKQLFSLQDGSGERYFPKLAYYRSSEENQELAKLGVAFISDLREAFTDADIVTLHLRYVEGVTDQLITPELIGTMSESGLFINPARAELVKDEKGLLDLIYFSYRRRFIFDPFYDEGNAYLKYAEPESLSSIGLVRRKIALCPNVALTQHSAAVFGPEIANITRGEYGERLLQLLEQYGEVVWSK